MKQRRWLSAVLILALLAVLAMPAAAADWPQFLGEAGAQGVSDGAAAVRGSDLVLRWDKNTGSTWNDVPGTPIVVGDYVYYYSSQYLRKLELATGKEVAAVPVYGQSVNQFFINIAYGEGKIFVPCQTDNLDDGVELEGCFLRVFDAETLEPLYVTASVARGQMQSPVMVHDGYFVTGTYGREGVYAGFTTADEDLGSANEIKAPAWVVESGSKRGFSFNGAAFVGDYCYFGGDNVLYTVNYRTGETRRTDIGEGRSICSTITYSTETERLYVACDDSDGGAAVFAYALDGSGLPVFPLAWHSGTEGGGTQSSPVVYNGRLYIGGGGHTMGSNEPFHVLDAATMREIYSVPIRTKGSAGISTAYATEENGWMVYIYMVPYAPNQADHSELWIITDRQGQTEAKYEIVDEIARRQFCSQSVIVAHDGSLLWYNDAGRIYCYENTAGVFEDTAGHWARESIAALARKKIVNGTGGGLFTPNGTVTRAQFVQILANMSGEDFSARTTDAFADVAAGEWYAPAVAWAVESGIVDTEQDHFLPNEPIIREDMALMLYRYGENVARAELAEVNAPVTFADAGDIAPGAAEAVAAMQRGGIINGISEGGTLRFAPRQQATRAQAAAMIDRFLGGLRG